jgi:hypothetical protein
MTLRERASRYVAALPAAISGSHGHDALLAAMARTALVELYGSGDGANESNGI